MSSISWGGTLTLLLLWFIGPCIYLGIWVVKLMKENKTNNTENKDDVEIVVDELEREGDNDNDGNGNDGSGSGVGGDSGGESDGGSGNDNDNDNDNTNINDNDNEKGQRLDSNNWTSTEYIFTLVGYAIGMSNVWRFCYVVAQNGGAASVFAYIICTIFVGTPLFLYEMILGQYLQSSFALAWTSIKPRWEGLALSQFVMVVVGTLGTIS